MTALLAAISMLLRDSTATVLTISEARGRALLAAALAGLMDVLGVFVTVFGAIEISRLGVSVKSVLILGAMMVASAGGTYYWTKWSARIVNPEMAAMQGEIVALRKDIELRKSSAGGV